jgi:hypothetical protein
MENLNWKPKVKFPIWSDHGGCRHGADGALIAPGKDAGIIDVRNLMAGTAG